MKVKLQGEDDLVGYVSIKKFANRADCFKYKLTYREVMASQNSDVTVRSGFIQAESEQDAVRQVTTIVRQRVQGYDDTGSVAYANWCNTFGNALAIQFPTLESVGV